MSFLSKSDNLLEMTVIYVRINAKQPIKNLLHNAAKVLWKCDVYIKHELKMTATSTL